MVMVTSESIHCDICDKPGERYTVSYPDGIKVLDRCDRHARGVVALRDEPGEFTTVAARGRRGRLVVLSRDEIHAQRHRQD